VVVDSAFGAVDFNLDFGEGDWFEAELLREDRRVIVTPR
jgi:hypothetical protein